MDQYKVVIETKSTSDQHYITDWAIDQGDDVESCRVVKQAIDGHDTGLIFMIVNTWDIAMDTLRTFVHYDLKVGVQQWY